MSRAWIKACPRCGGTLFEDGLHHEVSCLQCGYWASGNPDDKGWKSAQKNKDNFPSTRKGVPCSRAYR